MVTNRFKQIYVDLASGEWVVTDETTDSNLRGVRVEVPTASNSWHVTHYRNTTKLIVQILDPTNSEIIPDSVTIIDTNTVLITFDEPVTGRLHLVFDKDTFYNIIPSPTPTAIPALTPTPSVTP